MKRWRLAFGLMAAAAAVRAVNDARQQAYAAGLAKGMAASLAAVSSLTRE